MKLKRAMWSPAKSAGPNMRSLASSRWNCRGLATTSTKMKTRPTKKRKRKNETDPRTFGGRFAVRCSGSRVDSRQPARDGAAGPGAEPGSTRCDGERGRRRLGVHRWRDRFPPQHQDQVDPQLYILQGRAVPLYPGQYGGGL